MYVLGINFEYFTGLNLVFFTYSTLVLTNVLNGLDLNMVGDKNDEIFVIFFFSQIFKSLLVYITSMEKDITELKNCPSIERVHEILVANVETPSFRTLLHCLNLPFPSYLIQFETPKS